jgi:hypothetical protein
MPAKAPLDVDLEDKLVYGLTPLRLAYLAAALLGGFSTWSTPWAPPLARAAAALLVVIVGAASAWGRWRGRAADRWATDLAIFVYSNYRIEWTLRFDKIRRRRPQTTVVGETVVESLAAAA